MTLTHLCFRGNAYHQSLVISKTIIHIRQLELNRAIFFLFTEQFRAQQCPHLSYSNNIPSLQTENLVHLLPFLSLCSCTQSTARAYLQYKLPEGEKDFDYSCRLFCLLVSMGFVSLWRHSPSSHIPS